MARRRSLVNNCRRWVTSNKMKTAVYVGILINCLFAIYGMSGVLGTDAQHGKGEGKGKDLAPTMMKAYFDESTEPCIISNRTFLKLLVSRKRSNALPILQDDEEFSCFQGSRGSFIIELREAMNLTSIQFRFHKGYEQFWPRTLIIFGSEDQDEWELLTKVDIKKYETEQRFNLKTQTMPSKYLKIVVAENWGGQKTLVVRIKVQ